MVWTIVAVLLGFAAGWLAGGYNYLRARKDSEEYREFYLRIKQYLKDKYGETFD